MISIFKRIFDSVQSGPVDFNVVTGEWSFRKEMPIGKRGPPPISKWKRLKERETSSRKGQTSNSSATQKVVREID
jgi:hypothetical protein